MSKASKVRSQQKRRKQKVARKLAMKAQYEAWRDAGQNKRKARGTQKVERKVKAIRHAMAFCGNVGCRRCYPKLNERI